MKSNKDIRGGVKAKQLELSVWLSSAEFQGQERASWCGRGLLSILGWGVDGKAQAGEGSGGWWRVGGA